MDGQGGNDPVRSLLEIEQMLIQKFNPVRFLDRTMVGSCFYEVYLNEIYEDKVPVPVLF